MYYIWINEYDLRGNNTAWLQSACRERGIDGYFSMDREQLVAALLCDGRAK